MDKDRLSRAVLALSELMSRLRGPDGCPWDSLQTYSTIKMYLLEEAYEVLDAVEKGSREELSQELGDLLFQIIFFARLAEEKGEFDLVDVVEKIREKMVKRHPHVFGPATVRSAEEVADQWEIIKKSEKGISESSSSLLQIPLNLPALLRAHRLVERASRAGFDWPIDKEIWAKVTQDFSDLTSACRDQDKDRIGKGLGQLLFSLVTLAGHWGLNAEDLLRSANLKFYERFVEMEKGLRAKVSPIDPEKDEFDDGLTD